MAAPARLHTHSTHLWDGPLHLRPMTEADWPTLHRWNNDPQVLYYAEADDVTSWDLAEMQAMYRNVSEHAEVFIAELNGRPIGEGWLQEMNLPRVLACYPGLDVRRIDLSIGERALWGQGWGTRIIRLLVGLAFERYGCDLLYEPEIADYNLRSRRAFQRNGFVIVQAVPQPPGKASVAYDLVLTRERYRLVRSGVGGR